MIAGNARIAVEADLSVIDSHHHLWIKKGQRYLMDEFEADVAACGHDVVASIFAECNAEYRSSGPREMQPVGEAEFVRVEANKSATGTMANKRLCTAFIGAADLSIGAAVDDVLQALEEASAGRFRGIRCAVYWDPDLSLNLGLRPYAAQGVLLDKTFRQGFRKLADRGLIYDAWQYEPQLPELCNLADAFPDTTMVVNHCGGPVGVNAYATSDRFERWRRAICEVARRPNTQMKLSGLAAKRIGLGLENRTTPATAIELAAVWRPYVEACIEAFGAQRCIWGSNYPVEASLCDYGTLIDAYKLATGACSDAEKEAIFSGNATRTYSLSYPL